MDAGLWKKIRASFHYVLELPAGSVEGYLLELKDSDPAIAEEVQKLWHNHCAAGDFMEKPAAEHFQTGADNPDYHTGAIIGSFRILKTLGEGGMGKVYLAEVLTESNRRVALKVIRQGLASKHVLARFKSEYKTLARMNHQNIAAILHVGTTDDDLPFFVMEYVDGIPITCYCDQKRLRLSARIDLFLQAVQAVKHAHENGAIHRDLKPSNLLVTEKDGHPHVKIIDFGIVKATEPQPDESALTHSGLILGTLAYMSPEQAGITKVPIGPYTDVYAMGILLYELVTGVSPFGTDINAPFHIQLNKIRDIEPRLPSHCFSEEHCEENSAWLRSSQSEHLKQTIRGDLDAIIMKAMKKAPNQRYENMDQFHKYLIRFQEQGNNKQNATHHNKKTIQESGYKKFMRSFFNKGKN